MTRKPGFSQDQLRQFTQDLTKIFSWLTNFQAQLEASYKIYGRPIAPAKAATAALEKLRAEMSALVQGHLPSPQCIVTEVVKLQKYGLTEQQHRQYGVELKEIVTYLGRLSGLTGNAYAQSHQLVRSAKAAEKAAGKLRCVMDDVVQVGTQFSDNEANNVYYGHGDIKPRTLGLGEPR